jgi:DNA transposition AAA+ family ATPase
MDATPIAPDEAGRILDEIEEVRLALGMNHKQMAQVLGVQRSIWSEVRERKYTGDSDTPIRRARRFLDNRAARTETPQTEYCQTSIGRQIMAVCMRAYDGPYMSLVIAPAGAGKTMALRQIIKRIGESAIYLQAGEAFRTTVDLFSEIGDKIGLKVGGKHRSCRTVYSEVRNRLAGRYRAGKGDQAILLIDEATTLRPNSLNALRNLHDDLSCRVAVVLADTWRLDRELHSANRIPGGYEQLLRRCGPRYIMRSPAAITLEDCRLIADSTLKSLGYNRRLTDAAYDYLHGLARLDGAFGNVVHRLHAVMDAAPNGTMPAFTVRQLDYVAPMLGADCKSDHSTIDPFAGNAVARMAG